jgi:hypothetical protein
MTGNELAARAAISSAGDDRERLPRQIVAAKRQQVEGVEAEFGAL